MSVYSDPSREPSSHPLLSHLDGVAETWRDLVLLAGRVSLGWIFMQSGFRKIFDMAAVAQSYPARGLPEFMAYVATPVELAFGVFLILGFATRYAALVMLIFTIVASFSSHAFWTYPDAQRAMQHTHFWKNMSIKGGFLLLFIIGAGRYSVDYLLRKRG